MLGSIISMNKFLIFFCFLISSQVFGKTYDITFPSDWSVKEKSFGADYFAYTPITINKDSASVFIKEYNKKIKDPLAFIKNDIEKNISKNSKKYKNLNIYKSSSKKLGEELFHIVDYYYFDNTKNKIIFSQISILNLPSSYLYINYAGDEATYNDYKDSVLSIMKSIRRK